MPFLDEIKQTWTRKGITQKQHYSEARDSAVTDRDMRKHSKRVRNLPPCDPTMDLMIEAKDKEQAVFELCRKYGIGGKGLFNEMIPHTRTDENPLKQSMKTKKTEEEEEPAHVIVEEGDLAMGGKERRVYWPEGKEDWLSPPKKIRKKKEVAEEFDERVTVKEEHPVAVAVKATNGRRKTKDTNGEEVTDKAEVAAKHTRTRRQTKKPTEAEVDPSPSPKTAKQRVAGTKRQRIEVRPKTDEGSEEQTLATALPIVATPKRTRILPARKVAKKMAVPSPDSSSNSSFVGHSR